MNLHLYLYLHPVDFFQVILMKQVANALTIGLCCEVVVIFKLDYEKRGKEIINATDLNQVF